MLHSVEYTYVSSRLVKEVFRLGGDVARLVPPVVLESLKARLLRSAGRATLGAAGPNRILNLKGIFCARLALECIDERLSIRSMIMPTCDAH